MERNLKMSRPRKPLNIKLSSSLITIFASAFLAFGLYNVHSVSNVTEGGVLGATLLLDYWFHISPAFTSFVLNTICYIIGWKMLGKDFIYYSVLGTLGFSISYRIFEQFDPLFPQIADMPLLAAIVGALFVGIGAGLCVRMGGAPTGDDALAMGLSKVTHIQIQWVYLISDLTVLALSLTYIPWRRIIYSLLTVVLSGQIIGIIQKIPWPPRKRQKDLPQ